jgi:hypothetical protein
VPPEDPPSLAAALAAALDHPDEARRRGAAGRLRLDERFRPEHAVRRWQRAVLGGGAAGIHDVGGLDGIGGLDDGVGGLGDMGAIGGIGGPAEEEDGFRR